MFDRIVILAAAATLLPVQAVAQDWREVTSFRQRSDETRLDVHLRYGAGELVLEPGATGELYRVGIRYDSEAFDPLTEYRSGKLSVGVEGSGSGVKLRNTESGTMTLSLSRDVPLDLDLDFGAVEARLDMGGLRVARLDIETGASDTEVVFSRPNPVECEILKVAMGAAALDVRGLGHANCGRIKLEAGVGDAKLDFSGTWQRDMTAAITMALGSATLHVPSDVGVRLTKDTFLTRFDGRRFHKRDGAHYSDNWETARHRLTIDLEGAFGTLDVRWLGPTTTAP